jgi:O-antigen ligase
MYKTFLLASDENKAENIRFVLILLLAFSLPFDALYSQIVLWVLLLSSIIGFKKEMLQRIPKQAWIFISIYLLAIIGTFYSSNRAEANFLLEKQLTILLLPLILPFAIEFLDIYRKRLVLKALIAGSFLAVLFLFEQSIYFLIENDLPLKYIFLDSFFNHNFSKPLGIHASYLSLYVALSIFYLTYSVTKQRNIYKIIASILILCILLAGLIFLASRSVIIATLFVLIFLLPFFIIGKKPKYFIYLGVISGSILILSTQVDYIKYRFGTELWHNLNEKSRITNNNQIAEPRIEIWKCGIELIKDAPFFGHGTGDEVLKLRKKYSERGLTVSYQNKFNVHNQYLSFTLKHGILGGLIFIAVFAFFLSLGIKNKDFIYVSFIILLLVAFFSENILDRNKGILFFAFFNTLLGYFYFLKKPAPTFNS